MPVAPHTAYLKGLRIYTNLAAMQAETYTTNDVGSFLENGQTEELYQVINEGLGSTPGVLQLVAPLSIVAPAYAEFYGLTAGTGNGGPTDYAATVAVKTTPGTGRLPIPRLGPASTPSPATLLGLDAITVVTSGIYDIVFQAHTTEPGQLMLEIDGSEQNRTIVTNDNPTSGGHPIHGHSIQQLTAGQVVAVINPPGNSTALTITPADGADTWARPQKLILERIG